MSYLHIGKNVMVSRRRIIGVFDLDITSQSHRTREFLERAEKRRRGAGRLRRYPQVISGVRPPLP